MPFLALIALHTLYGAAAIRLAPTPVRGPKAASRSRVLLTLVFAGLCLEGIGASMSTVLPLPDSAGDPGFLVFGVGAILVLSSGFPASLQLSSRIAVVEGAGRLAVIAAALPIAAAFASLMLLVRLGA